MRIGSVERNVLERLAANNGTSTGTLLQWPGRSERRAIERMIERKWIARVGGVLFLTDAAPVQVQP